MTVITEITSSESSEAKVTSSVTKSQSMNNIVTYANGDQDYKTEYLWQESKIGSGNIV
jgi:hypothetical protein